MNHSQHIFTRQG